MAGSVLIETHDEWQVTDRRHLCETSMALLDQPATTDKEVANTELLSA